VKGEQGERWRELCELAAKEQDHDKLIALVKQINHMLEEKERRLKQLRKGDGATAGQ
jgi:hypothetical protein